MRALSYAIVTPVRDEAENIERLAACLVAQTRLPAAWVVVDDGSRDGTGHLVETLAREHPWIRLVANQGDRLSRGGPIARAFQRGLATLDPIPDLVVKLDADISLEERHYEQLVSRFEADPHLGIAGGVCYEEQSDGVWRQRHGTGSAVWGACRAYRRDCLDEILPLEEHMGWDTLDLMKASMLDWKVQVFYDLAFRHHRTEGERDGGRLRTWIIQGEASHFMDYRFSYLLVRTMYRVTRDPSATGLLLGFARARFRGSARCGDPALRRYVRDQQRVRKLPLRTREALRPRTPLTGGWTDT